MTARIDEELELLRSWWVGLEYEATARWVLLRGYHVPAGIWNHDVLDVAFQIPAHLPAEAPYGFYVRPGLALISGAAPSNYTYPSAEPPFGDGPWGKFSWAPVAWQPTVEARGGDNMVCFASSIADRLREAS
jgi:hypothetical protein